MDEERFPIGGFRYDSQHAAERRPECIEDMRNLPRQLRAAIAGLDDRQLDSPYRDGGWTVRQVVHHLADSHLNAYTRLRLALTEDAPTIRPYDEASWAELVDARTAPLDDSLAILDGVHGRMSGLWASLGPEQFERTLYHPESGTMSLDRLLQLYAWHGRHHVAHVTALRDRMGW